MVKETTSWEIQPRIYEKTKKKKAKFWEMSDLIGIFIWVDDKPIQGNVQKLSSITKPIYFNNELQTREFHYKVGMEIEAKWRGNGKICRGVLGMIGGLSFMLHV